MADWWTSKASLSLLGEVNRRWPDRSKATDGTLGDAAHAATVSDHNPNANGEVCALDITAEGINAPWLFNQLVTKSNAGDRRVKYVIYNRMICEPAVSPFPRAYRGVDPHTSHIHVSFNAWAAGTPAWGVATNNGAVVPVSATADVPGYPGVTREGMSGDIPRAYQQRLFDRGWRIVVDGQHGPGTTAVLVAFQREKGLPADGVGGPMTWNALWRSQL